MAIVSISEASRLAGKARSTIQTYIKTGKLSKTTDAKSGVVGIDISELTRVFGDLKKTPKTGMQSSMIIQQTTSDNTDESLTIKHLEKEIELLKTIILEKEEHNKSLKQAMNLLEHKKEETFPKKGFFKRLFNR